MGCKNGVGWGNGLIRSRLQTEWDNLVVILSAVRCSHCGLPHAFLRLITVAVTRQAGSSTTVFQRTPLSNFDQAKTIPTDVLLSLSTKIPRQRLSINEATIVPCCAFVAVQCQHFKNSRRQNPRSALINCHSCKST
jgi:hypothetical protein